LNVHLYYEDGDSENLGLIRKTGFATAETLLSLVKKNLESYGFKMQHDIEATSRKELQVLFDIKNVAPIYEDSESNKRHPR
jgi:hypothetical protein